jgi:hypothetical protein
MISICHNKIIKRILKVIKRKNTPNCAIGYIANNDICSNQIINNNQAAHNKIDIKERVTRLIKENEKYFLYEITRTTADIIIHHDYPDIQKLKTFSYAHGVAVDIFEKHGIFMYITDLSGCIYAPNAVKRELQELIDEYGIDKVTEYFAIYLKNNYQNQFGIHIVCTP